MKKKYPKKELVFLVFLLGVFGLNFLGALITKANLDPWYQSLIKPSFNPPSWVFGPVWTFLYIIIAWVGALVWLMPTSSHRGKLLNLWLAQMLLNFLWSFIFFGFHQMLLAALELTCLIGVVAVLTTKLYKVSKIAFSGFFLYLAWIIYAGILNWTLYGLNHF
jgi:benzodiazapine receptor